MHVSGAWLPWGTIQTHCLLCSRVWDAATGAGCMQDVRKQLLAIMDRYKLELSSAGRDYSRICKAITSGYYFHAVRKDAQEGYKTIVRSCCC